jgi:hypothetical protein
MSVSWLNEQAPSSGALRRGSGRPERRRGAAPAQGAALGFLWARADGAGCAESPPPLRSARSAGSARHPSTLLGMALSRVEGPQRGQAKTSKPNVSAHEVRPEPRTRTQRLRTVPGGRAWFGVGRSGLTRVGAVSNCRRLGSRAFGPIEVGHFSGRGGVGHTDVAAGGLLKADDERPPSLDLARDGPEQGRRATPPAVPPLDSARGALSEVAVRPGSQRP